MPRALPDQRAYDHAAYDHRPRSASAAARVGRADAPRPPRERHIRLRLTRPPAIAARTRRLRTRRAHPRDACRQPPRSGATPDSPSARARAPARRCPPRRRPHRRRPARGAGRIEAVGTAGSLAPDGGRRGARVDLAGYLLLPAPAEPHAHYDTALTAARGSDGAAVARPEDVQRRATEAALLQLGHGATALRTHVRIGDVAGPALAGGGAAGPARAPRPRRPDHRRRAPAADRDRRGRRPRRCCGTRVKMGATVVGGCPDLDPDPAGYVDAVLDVAAEHGCAVDLHTDGDDPARLARLAAMAGGLRPGVTLGPCGGLARLPHEAAARTADRLAAAGVTVVCLPQGDCGAWNARLRPARRARTAAPRGRGPGGRGQRRAAGRRQPGRPRRPPGGRLPAGLARRGRARRPPTTRSAGRRAGRHGPARGARRGRLPRRAAGRARRRASPARCRSRTAGSSCTGGASWHAPARCASTATPRAPPALDLPRQGRADPAPAAGLSGERARRRTVGGMRTVIAGGHGQIALRLERLLAGRGDEVAGLIRNPAQADDLRAAGAEPVVCDLESASVEEVAAHPGGRRRGGLRGGRRPGQRLGPQGRRWTARGRPLRRRRRAGGRTALPHRLLDGRRPPNRPPARTPSSPRTCAPRAPPTTTCVPASDLDWTILRPGTADRRRAPARSSSPRRRAADRCPATTWRRCCGAAGHPGDGRADAGADQRRQAGGGRGEGRRGELSPGRPTPRGARRYRPPEDPRDYRRRHERWPDAEVGSPAAQWGGVRRLHGREHPADPALRPLPGRSSASPS